MHAVILRSTIHDVDEGRAFLREQVVPRVSQAPGLVAAYWVRLDGNRGTAMLVFDSEEAARAATDQVGRPPEDVVTIDSVELGEVVERV